MTRRLPLPLPLLLSAVLVSSVGFVSSAHADPPPGNHRGGAPAGATPAQNNMAAHGNPPVNNAQPGRGGPGLDIHAGVNVGIGGQPMGGRPVVRGAPIVYDANRWNHDEDARLAQRDIARRNAAVWESQRFQREAEHRRELEARWGQEFYYRPECRYEISLDANRTAQLVRIIDVAEDNHDPVLAARARNILARENARHAREMIALRIRLGYQ